MRRVWTSRRRPPWTRPVLSAPRQLSVVVVVVVHHGSWITRIVSHPWTQCTAVTRSPPGPSASRPPPPPTPFAASRWTPQRGMARMVRDAARGPWGVQAFRRLGDTMRHGRHHHLTRRVVTKHSTSGSVVRVRPIPKRTSAHTHTHTYERSKKKDRHGNGK